MSSYMKAACRCDITATQGSPVPVNEKELLQEQIRSRDWDSVGEQLARDREVLARAEEGDARRAELASRQRAAQLQHVRAHNEELREQAQAHKQLEARDEAERRAQQDRPAALRQEIEADLSRAAQLREEASRVEAEARRRDEEDRRHAAEGLAATDATVAAAEEGGEPGGPLYKDNDRYRMVGGHRVKKEVLDMQKRLQERRRRQQQEYDECQQAHQADSDEERNTRSALVQQKTRKAEEKVAQGRLAQAREEEERVLQIEEEERKRARVHPIDILQRQIAADLIAEREQEVADLDEMGDNSTDWVGKLDMYMELERDAWREHAALERQSGGGGGRPARVPHVEAVAQARREQLALQARETADS
eukprot:TRINITY_DN50008_c0_g1_i1.p2 TRINITY_DN50008_c0_g1~~TRINITY_DN50008_c0_g1_i1.p2  ORF type:complete len:396 (+),score=176.49 TRINITY_DN50008_c0_g1_i1:94-1188(+)